MILRLTQSIKPQASTSERVGNSRPCSAGIFSKSSSENNGNNHKLFFVPNTLNRVKGIMRDALQGKPDATNSNKDIHDYCTIQHYELLMISNS